MDAFFASVEQRDHPKYRGNPVIVGANPRGGTGRGVVSACSYRARKYNIHSAMPVSIAYRRCPQAVFLPVNMEKYRRESVKIFEILKDFTPKIEKISIDEAFLDITGSYHLFGSVEDTVRKIKKKIKNETGLTASIGLAPNKFVAKIASDFDKPDGLKVVKKDKIKDFLFPLKVEKIWGVGEKTARELKNMGIRTLRDLALMSKEKLYNKFGKRGFEFWYLARGMDDRTVKSSPPAKSVSHEYTFDKNTSKKEKIRAVLLELSEKVSGRLRKANLKGKTVTLKIRLEGFNTFTRSVSGSKGIDSTGKVFKKVEKLYAEFNKKKVRLLGVKVDNFSKNDAQLSLFDREDDKKKQKLYGAVDKVRKKYGTRALYRAGTMLTDDKKDEKK